MAQSTIWDFFYKKVCLSRDCVSKKQDGGGSENLLLFNSARSAIAFSLKAAGIGRNTKVIVSCFTCDAVTFAVNVTGATPLYVDINQDLTMERESVLEALKEHPSAIIVQNTFGRMGLEKETLDLLKNKGLFVLVDNSLSVGSRKDNVCLNSYGTASVYTLECSKTVTIGGGGVLQLNDLNLLQTFSQNYEKIPIVSVPSDVRKIFQLTLSNYLQKYSSFNFLGPLVWYFFYLTKIFKGSRNQNFEGFSSIKRMGAISNQFFYFIKDDLNTWFDKTEKNVLLITDKLLSSGFYVPVIPFKNEKLVSPRVSFCVPNECVSEVVRHSLLRKVELGRWFVDIAPCVSGVNVDRKRFPKGNKISQGVFNLPAYFTLSRKEKLEIFKFIDEISLIISKNKGARFE